LKHSDETGFTTVQYVAASALSLVLFVLCANVLVDLYLRGAVRDALDEGVRAAVPAAADARECETRAREVIDSIAGGAVMRVDDLRCTRDGAQVVATARVVLRSWLPGAVPDWRMQFRASARIES
jgi:hypothetical protein